MMMRTINKLLKLFLLTLVFVTSLGTVLPASVYGQAPAIEDKADQLLRKMSDYLDGLKQFSVQTENTLEVVLKSGQKIQYDNPAELNLQRPNKLHAKRVGDIVDQELYYDGKTLTLYQKDQNYFATIEVPPTIDETIDFARDYLDLFCPGGDLIYSSPYRFLTEDVISGFYVGMSIVSGTRCHHLAFRGNEVDWQIWIEEGTRPLPKKFIVTSKWMTGAPQFTVVINSWDLSPQLTENTFTFEPPKKAQKIDFIRLTGSGHPGT